MTSYTARLWLVLRGMGESPRGNSAVEFALAAPILIALCFGGYDYGSAYVEGVRLSGAARAGAQQALYDASTWQNDSLIEQTALEEYVGHPLTDAEIASLSISATSLAFCACQAGLELACSATCPDGSSPGRFVQVSLNRSVPLTLPYPWASAGSTPVTGEAVVRVR
jgi:Flp pilus assembly protein TadG